jgi:hypothetical protein
VAFDIGAIAERLRQLRTGTLLPLETSTTALNDRLLLLAEGEGAVPLPEECAATDDGESEGAEWLQFCRDHEVSHGGIIMVKKQAPSSSPSQSQLTATAEAITLNQGLYLFYVRTASPVRETTGTENLTLPAVQIGLAPGVASENVNFISGPQTRGTWLCEPGNMIVAKISGAPATLILTSIRKAGGQPLAIDVDRLDGRTAVGEPTRPAAEQPAVLAMPAIDHAATGQRAQEASALPAPSPQADVRCEIVAHVQNQGDLSFVDAEWAGEVSQHLWIENFRIRPLNGVAPEDIEYKGLTINGYETPWIAGGEECGTRQMATPLIAFAVRMRSRNGTPTAAYDCEYSGHFQSGTVVGPVANGTPCRSTVPNDPLEGIRVRITARKPVTTRSSAGTRKPAIGPRFSKLREEGVHGRPDVASDPAIALPDDRLAGDAASRAPWATGTAGHTKAGLSAPEQHGDARAGGPDAGRAGAVPDEDPTTDAIGAGGPPLSRAALMKHVLPFLSR